MNPLLHYVALPADSSIRGVLPPESETNNPAFADVFGRHLDGRIYPHMPNLTSTASVHLRRKQDQGVLPRASRSQVVRPGRRRRAAARLQPRHAEGEPELPRPVRQVQRARRRQRHRGMDAVGPPGRRRGVPGVPRPRHHLQRLCQPQHPRRWGSSPTQDLDHVRRDLVGHLSRDGQPAELDDAAPGPDAAGLDGAVRQRLSLQLHLLQPGGLRRAADPARPPARA